MQNYLLVKKAIPNLHLQVQINKAKAAKEEQKELHKKMDLELLF
jgi:hypothetical protein